MNWQAQRVLSPAPSAGAISATRPNIASSGSDEGTTRSATESGTLVVLDKDRQTQDIASLSRDTENANGRIDAIFDREKEQKKIQEAQLIADIANQVMDVARTQGEITAENAKKDPEALQAAKEKLAGKGNQHPTDEQVAEQAYNTAMAQYGTGSDTQRAIQGATALIQGLAGGDVTAALAGAAAPYIAEAIGHRSGLEGYEKAAAHAVANAALAILQGNDALAGAAGAITGELAGSIALDMYGRDVNELNESEKQTISALATLAAGLAGGIAGDSTASAASGAQAGKTVVENNLLGGSEEAQIKFMQEHGKNMASCSTDPGGSACLKGLEMNNALMVALPAGLGGGILAAATPEIAAAARVAMAACAGNIVLCLNNAGIHISEAIIPGGTGAGGAIGIGKTVNEAKVAKTIANNIQENIVASQAARASSNFGQFSKAEGSVQESLGIWPPNRGAYGPIENVTLPTGTIIDRYGYPGGSFVSPVGVPFEQRALPSSYQNTKPYFQYEILKPIDDVSQGKILPWFGQKGQGTQYELPKPVQWYLDHDYIKKAKK